MLEQRFTEGESRRVRQTVIFQENAFIDLRKHPLHALGYVVSRSDILLGILLYDFALPVHTLNYDFALATLFFVLGRGRGVSDHQELSGACLGDRCKHDLSQVTAIENEKSDGSVQTHRQNSSTVKLT